MKRLLQSLIIATGVVAASGAAMAADIIRPPPAAKPVVVVTRAYDWSGHYIGIQGGWDNNHASTPPYASDENGGIAGIYGGVNFQHAGNWVFGLDASINWDWARTTTTSPALCCGATFEAGPHWKGFIRGRLGLALDRILIYGTGGAAVMGYQVTGAGAGSATPWGWTAGLGAEFAVHSNWTLRFDWAYQDYGTFHLNTGTPVSVTANTFMVGLAAKF